MSEIKLQEWEGAVHIKLTREGGGERERGGLEGGGGQGCDRGRE